jgi:hypothetical protein
MKEVARTLSKWRAARREQRQAVEPAADNRESIMFGADSLVFRHGTRELAI